MLLHLAYEQSISLNPQTALLSVTISTLGRYPRLLEI